MSRPFVSVLTPTYNRAKFIPAMVECYKAQTYPKDRMEWIIMDDGTEKVEALVKELTKGIPNVRYIALPEKLTIGAKRNLLNKEAKGDICICMDDDDYYVPERVAHGVYKIMSRPNVELAGSSQIFIYFTDTQEIIQFGPYGPNHATNGTFVYKSSYGKTHLYDESCTFAEERSFLEDYKHPMVQLDPMKVMLVSSHSENTFDKKKLRDNIDGVVVKRTKYKVKDFIKDKKLCAFYSNP
jgi:glycosyltransferase involved in cell wall biosynthesis